ncbi:MAG TPA: hypothetical protein VGL24_04125 [Chthoniobacterales bacterium]
MITDSVRGGIKPGKGDRHLAGRDFKHDMFVIKLVESGINPDEIASEQAKSDASLNVFDRTFRANAGRNAHSSAEQAFSGHL